MEDLLDYTISNNKVSFYLYDVFNIVIPIDYWEFMCQKRWFTDTPTKHEVEVEFGVCGARKAANDDEANEIVKKAIETIYDFVEEDTILECEEHLDNSKRIVGHMDEKGTVYFSEVNK